MFTSYPMYECFGYIRLPGEEHFQWIKGFEVGIDKATGLYVFFVGNDVRQRFYLTEGEIHYEDRILED